MNTLLVLSALMGQVDAPASVVIFGREAWYRTVKGDEETFTGTLERIPGAGRNSRSAYTIVTGQGGNTTREVFVGGNNAALGNLAGRRVRITGMAVDLKVEGRMRYEVWVNRIEFAGGGGGIVVGPGGMGEGGILASTDWQVPIGPGNVPLIGTGQIQVVAKTPAEVLNVLGGKQQNVDNLYKAMNIRNVDFRRNMVVFLSGGICRGPGHQVELLGIEQAGLAYLVKWRLLSPDGIPANGNLTHPGKVFIIPRTEGVVRFDPPAVRR